MERHTEAPIYYTIHREKFDLSMSSDLSLSLSLVRDETSHTVINLDLYSPSSRCGFMQRQLLTELWHLFLLFLLSIEILFSPCCSSLTPSNPCSSFTSITPPLRFCLRFSGIRPPSPFLASTLRVHHCQFSDIERTSSRREDIPGCSRWS